MATQPPYSAIGHGISTVSTFLNLCTFVKQDAVLDMASMLVPDVFPPYLFPLLVLGPESTNSLLERRSRSGSQYDRKHFDTSKDHFRKTESGLVFARRESGSCGPFKLTALSERMLPKCSYAIRC